MSNVIDLTLNSETESDYTGSDSDIDIETVDCQTTDEESKLDIPGSGTEANSSQVIHIETRNDSAKFPIVHLNKNEIVEPKYLQIKLSLEQCILDLFEPINLSLFQNEILYHQNLSRLKSLGAQYLNNNSINSFFVGQQACHDQAATTEQNLNTASNHTTATEYELLPRSVSEVWKVNGLIKMLFAGEIDYAFLYQYGLANLNSFKDIFIYILELRFDSNPAETFLPLPPESSLKQLVPFTKKMHDQTLAIMTESLLDRSNKRNLWSGNDIGSQLFTPVNSMGFKSLNNVANANSPLRHLEPFANAKILNSYRQKIREILTDKNDTTIKGFNALIYSQNSKTSNQFFCLLCLRLLFLKKGISYFELLLSFDFQLQD